MKPFNLDDYTLAAQKLHALYNTEIDAHYLRYAAIRSRALRREVEHIITEEEAYRQKWNANLSRILGTKVTVRPVKSVIDP